VSQDELAQLLGAGKSKQSQNRMMIFPGQLRENESKVRGGGDLQASSN